jgi:hypothetical protein
MLKITNKNEFDLIDRYDGHDYKFPAGKTVRCHENAAAHIFGFGDDNKIPYITRQGWVRHSGEFEKGLAILGKFHFEMIEEKYDEGLARIEQRKAPLHQMEAESEPETDGSEEDSVSTRKGGKKGGNIMNRFGATA